MSLQDWQAQRPQIRARLFNLLGDLPAAFTPEVQSLGMFARESYTIEKLGFKNGLGDPVFAYWLLPIGYRAPLPAVLYLHFHGGRYKLGKDEALLDRASFPAPGIALVRAGFAVLVIDSYAFGERRLYEGREDAEMSYFKQFLWEGRSLWGMIVHDDLLALNWLAAQDIVDTERISALGMSMGGSRATWLAALDERVSCVIPIAQMTRYQDFARHKEYFHHGIYYYLPAVLKSGLDMEHLTMLIAPRRQLILIGEADPLSPWEGVCTIDAFTRGVYSLYDASANYRLISYPGVAHEYSAEMFQEAMHFLQEG